MAVPRPRPPPLSTSPSTSSGPSSPPSNNTASNRLSRASKALSILKLPSLPSPSSSSSPSTPTYPLSIPLTHPALSGPPTPARPDLPSVYVVSPTEEGQRTVLAFDSHAPPSPRTPDLALLEATVLAEAAAQRAAAQQQHQHHHHHHHQQQQQRAEHPTQGQARRYPLPPPDIGIPKFRRLSARQMQMEGVVLPRRRDTAPPPRNHARSMYVRRSETDPAAGVVGARAEVGSSVMEEIGGGHASLPVLGQGGEGGSPRLPPTPPPNMPLPPLPGYPFAPGSFPAPSPFPAASTQGVDNSDGMMMLPGAPSRLSMVIPPRRIGSPPPSSAPPLPVPGPAPVPQASVRPVPVRVSSGMQGRGRPLSVVDESGGVYHGQVPFPSDAACPPPTAPPPQTPATLLAHTNASKRISIIHSPPARTISTCGQPRSGSGSGSGSVTQGQDQCQANAKPRKRSSTLELMKRRSGFFGASASSPEVDKARDGDDDEFVGEEEEEDKTGREGKWSSALGKGRRRSLFFQSTEALVRPPSGPGSVSPAGAAVSGSTGVVGEGAREVKGDAMEAGEAKGEEGEMLRPARRRSQSEKGLRRPKSLVGFAGLVMGSARGTPAPTEPSSSAATPAPASPPGSNGSAKAPVSPAPTSPAKAKSTKEQEKEKKQLKRPKSLMGLGRHFTVPLKSSSSESAPPVPPIPGTVPPKSAPAASASHSTMQSTDTAGLTSPGKKEKRKSFYNLPSLSLSHHHLLHRERHDEQAMAELPGVKIDGIAHAPRKSSISSGAGAPAESGSQGKKLRRPKSLAGLTGFMRPSKSVTEEPLPTGRPRTGSTTSSAKRAEAGATHSSAAGPGAAPNRPGTASTASTKSAPRPPTSSSTASASVSAGRQPSTPSRPSTVSSDSPKRPPTSMSERSTPSSESGRSRTRTLSIGASKRLSTLFNFSSTTSSGEPPRSAMPTLPTLDSVPLLPEIPTSPSTTTLKTPVTPSFPSRTQLGLGLITSTPISSESSRVGSEHTSSPSLTDSASGDGSTDPSSELDTAEEDEPRGRHHQRDELGTLETLETLETLDLEGSPCSSAYDSAKEDLPKDVKAMNSPSVPSLQLAQSPFQGLGIDLRAFGVSPA